MIRRRVTNKKASDDYVTDGLLINLDGYDAPVSSKWKSRVNSYTFDSSNITYDSTNHKYNFSTYGTVSNQNINIGGNIITLQLVDDGTIYNNTSLAILFELSSNFNNYANSLIVDISEYFTRGLVAANRNTIHGYESAKWNNCLANGKAQYTFVLGSNIFILYVNGALKTIYENYTNDNGYSSLANYGSYPLYFGGRAQNSYVTKMGCHAMRMYNKQLSESEIAANLVIDKQRFNF